MEKKLVGNLRYAVVARPKGGPDGRGVEGRGGGGWRIDRSMLAQGHCT